MCDYLAIVDQGQVVVEGSPNDLKSKIQGDTVTMELSYPVKEATDLSSKPKVFWKWSLMIQQLPYESPAGEGFILVGVLRPTKKHQTLF